jgi:hypothetical protein
LGTKELYWFLDDVHGFFRIRLIPGLRREAKTLDSTLFCAPATIGIDASDLSVGCACMGPEGFPLLRYAGGIAIEPVRVSASFHHSHDDFISSRYLRDYLVLAIKL